jgi:WD40 repeat protein
MTFARNFNQKNSTFYNKILSIAFSPDRNYFVSGSSYKTAKLWIIELQKEVTMLQGHSHYVISVVFSPEGN